MADDEDEIHQAYLCLRFKDDEAESNQFSYGSDLESLKEWGSKRGEDKKNEDLKEDEDEGAVDPVKSTLSRLMGRVFDAGLALSELVMAQGAVKSVFSTIIARINIIEPTKKSSPVIYEGDGYKIYGISADRANKIHVEHRRLNRMDRGFDLLPSAVMMAIVATFDSITSDIVREMLLIKPERFEKSDKAISISEILSMQSFDDVRAKIIDDEVYQFSRGSHDEQVKSIERWFGIKIAEYWKRWPDFIELFERRNLIAHGEKRFTKRYVSICSSHGHKGSEKILGKEINLTRAYISQSLDVLIEFGLLLIFSIWRKQIPEDEASAYDNINEMCYRLISDERYRVPVRVIEYVLGLKGAKVSESTRLMLIVNLASAYMHSKNKEKACKILDGVDWSAVADNYKICVAAIRHDTGLVVSLMGRVVNSELLSKQDFRQWPVFSLVRRDDKFKDEFENLFGEPLFDPVAEATKIISESEAVDSIEGDDDGQGQSKAGTVH